MTPYTCPPTSSHNPDCRRLMANTNSGRPMVVRSGKGRRGAPLTRRSQVGLDGVTRRREGGWESVGVPTKAAKSSLGLVGRASVKRDGRDCDRGQITPPTPQQSITANHNTTHHTTSRHGALQSTKQCFPHCSSYICAYCGISQSTPTTVPHGHGDNSGTTQATLTTVHHSKPHH